VDDEFSNPVHAFGEFHDQGILTDEEFDREGQVLEPSSETVMQRSLPALTIGKMGAGRWPIVSTRSGR